MPPIIVRLAALSCRTGAILCTTSTLLVGAGTADAVSEKIKRLQPWCDRRQLEKYKFIISSPRLPVARRAAAAI